MTTVAELRALVEGHADQILSLQTHLDDYWEAFDPLFDWTPTEKIFRSASFLRREVVPRREAVLTIAQEIEELNNANLAEQRAEVTRRHAAFRNDLDRLLWRSLLLLYSHGTRHFADRFCSSFDDHGPIVSARRAGLAFVPVATEAHWLQSRIGAR